MDLSNTQARRLMVILATCHILVIASSNYLVQLPFTIAGLHTTWGAFSFPFVFLFTDLTVRLFGQTLARQIILRVMLPALIISYLASVLFADGHYVGFEGLSSLNTFVGRIAFASFTAYLFGQLLDIKVFNRLRQLRQWWVAPAASTLIGNFVDTLLFFSVAFYASADPFMAAHWQEIAWVDYSVKLVISLCIFLPLYGVLLSYLQNKLLLWTQERKQWASQA
jgi:uncharacterized integral membrane protein (TIGR00697 family)